MIGGIFMNQTNDKQKREGETPVEPFMMIIDGFGSTGVSSYHFGNGSTGVSPSHISNKRRVAILKQLFFSVVILFAFCPAVLADPVDDSGFSMGVPGIRSLTLDQNNIHFEPDIRQMVDGWTHQEVLIARVNANVDWVLTVRGSDDLWDGPWEKPVTDIYWKYGGGEYASLDMQSMYVASGGPTNHQAYPIHFKVKLDLALDVPGDYYYEYVIFELSSP